MIIDFRYHIASLVAVFLALGIGVVIGSLVVGDGLVRSIVSEQEHLVKRLEQDYDTLKKEARVSQEETQALRQSVDLYERFARESFPDVIAGRLEGMKITVLDNSDAPLPPSFLDNLEFSGAEVLRLLNTTDLYSAAGAEAAVFIINNSFLHGEPSDDGKNRSALVRSLDKTGVKYFLVDTGGNHTETNHQGEVYRICADGNILEQAALIFKLAGLSDRLPLPASEYPTDMAGQR